MEFITTTIGNLNWWAIIVATLATLPVGYVWYDMKIGFGKTWAKLNKLTIDPSKASDGMAAIFASMLTATFATAFLMACLMKATGVDGFASALVFGLLFGVVLRGGAHFVHNGFTQRPVRLTIIDVGHDLVSLTVIALIVGLWQ